MAAALGYLVGCLVSSLGPLVIVWIHDRMAWTGLMLRVAAGYVLVLTGVWFVTTHPGIGSNVLATLVFLTAWFAISWQDVVPRLHSLRGRAQLRRER